MNYGNTDVELVEQCEDLKRKLDGQDYSARYVEGDRLVIALHIYGWKDLYVRQVAWRALKMLVQVVRDL